MPDKKLPPENRERKPNDDEWAWIWDANDKAHKTWLIVGPIHAAVTNWRALIVIGGVLAWIKGPDILMLIRSLIEGAK